MVNDKLRTKIAHFALKFRINRLIQIILNITEYMKDKSDDDKRQAIKDILSVKSVR